MSEVENLYVAGEAVGGIDFTVYSLDGHWHALWQSGTVNYSLSAPITETELLAVLDSVK